MSERVEIPETAEKGTTLPAASIEKNLSQKRKPRSTESSSSRGRPKVDSGDLRFEAIRVLTNLPEGGKFFLTYEASDRAEAINCWN